MSSQHQASFFHKANNISFKDSTINATIHNHDSQASGIYLLSQKISTSAMHDSSARDPPPRCHPETRKTALQTVEAFVEDPSPEKAVLWMNAPFGHGKSAVVQTAIETLRASGRGYRVAGGFFFGRDKEGRDKAHYFLPTIIYQIAHNIPGMYEHVNNAINADPSVPSKSIEAQLIPLLVTPFLHHHPTSTHTPTIFIDGLDECDTPAAQRSVLKMIADVISVHRVPLRFIVTSRPEVHIAQCFKASPLSSITRSFQLDDDSMSMEGYFRDEFNKIYESRADDMSAVTRPWPSKDVVWGLVRRASGQYLFASTVIRFVGDEYDHPAEQLQVLLTPHPRQSSAFSSMDILYTQILSVCPIRLRPCLLKILGLIIFHKDDWVNIASIGDLLELAPSDVSTAIRSLQAIIEIKDLPKIPPHDTNFSISNYLSPTISIRHISLKEFLMDKARAGDFWVDLENMTAMLLRRSDAVLASSIFDSASPMTIHLSTWRYLLWPGWYDETTAKDTFSWPLFTRQFSKYRDVISTQSPPAECRLQSLKASSFLLGRWNNSRSFGRDVVSDEDFKTIQTIVAASLREQFAPQSRETLDLFALFAYFDSTERAMFAATSEAINERPDLSFDAALRAVNSASMILTLDNGNMDWDWDLLTWDVRVCVDWSIMDILMDPDLIGENLYIAHRNARILALSACYDDFLLQDNPSSISFRNKAWSVFRLPMISWGILMLDDNIDGCAGSAMDVLITRICSSRSLEVLCKTTPLDKAAPEIFVPFFLFVTMNCLEASILGPRFEGIHSKLLGLITTLLQAGVLASAFGYSDYHDSMMLKNNIIIYRNLFRMREFSQGRWLDLVDDKTHTAIIEFFLNTRVVELLCKRHPDPRDIPWSEHFSRANDSPGIGKCLLSLLHNDSPTLEDIGPLLPESFVTGVKIWKEKYLAGDLESARGIDRLCLELSSMDKLPISMEDQDSVASEGNEVDIDEDSEGEYEDAVEDLEYEDEV